MVVFFGVYDARVVVPPNLRDSIKFELHVDHSGTSRMKELARSYLWWLNLNKNLETLVNSCSLYLKNGHMPIKADLHQILILLNNTVRTL